MGRLIKPISLAELQSQLETDQHICLCQPFPYGGQCKVSFRVKKSEEQAFAVNEARHDLAKILLSNQLVQGWDFHGLVARLQRISEAFCCERHTGDIEKHTDFAFLWIGYDLIEDLLEARAWPWKHSEWRCLTSNYEGSCTKPITSDRPKRDAIYRSLYQLAVFKAFPDHFEVAFLENAVTGLVQRWLCQDHKKSGDTIMTKLIREIRQSCVEPAARLPSEPHSALDSAPLGSVDGRSDIEVSSPSTPPSSNSSVRSVMKSRKRRNSEPAVLASCLIVQGSPETPSRPTPVRFAVSDAGNTAQSTNDRLYVPQRGLRSRSPSPGSSTLPRKVQFFPFTASKETCRQTVNAVLDIIKQPVTAKSTGKFYEDGWIYVLQIMGPDHSDYVKIGRTTQLTTRRVAQIASCKKLNIHIVGEGTKIPYHERLENIIHADFHNERQYFNCACGTGHKKDGITKHGEWFKIDVQTAIRRVEQWRSWMRQEPYIPRGRKGQGNLKKDFRRRLHYCEKAEVSSDPEDRWNMFMTPFFMDSR